jgi:hypothetical protein
MERARATARRVSVTLVAEFYYKLTELKAIAEKLQCPRSLNSPRLGRRAALQVLRETLAPRRIDGVNAAREARSSHDFPSEQLGSPQGRGSSAIISKCLQAIVSILKNFLMDISKSANKYSFESGYLLPVRNAIQIFVPHQ